MKDLDLEVSVKILIDPDGAGNTLLVKDHNGIIL